MSIMCGVLHYRPTIQLADLATLEKEAIMTDKYDCVAAMSLWSQVAILKHLRKEIEHPEIGRLLYPSYAFDDPHTFAELTRLMVYNFEGGVDPLCEPFSRSVPAEIRDLLPYDIFSKTPVNRLPPPIL